MISIHSQVSTLEGMFPVSRVVPGDWIDTPEGFSKVIRVVYKELQYNATYSFEKILDQLDEEEPDELTKLAFLTAAEFDGKKVTGYRFVKFPLLLTREIIVGYDSGDYLDSISVDSLLGPCESFSLETIEKSVKGIPVNYGQYGKMKLRWISMDEKNHDFVDLVVDNQANTYYANNLEVFGHVPSFLY